MLKKAEDVDVASTAVFAVAMILTVSVAVAESGTPFAQGEGLLWAVVAGLGEGAYFVCLTRALDRAPLGWAYTWMRGSAVVFTWPVSLLLMGERLQRGAFASVAAVVGGLLLMGAGAGSARRRGAMAWVLLAGAFIAGFNTAYKAALDHGAQAAALFGVSMAVGVPVQIAVRVHRDGWDSLRRLPRPLGWVRGYRTLDLQPEYASCRDYRQVPAALPPRAGPLDELRTG